MWQIGLRNRLKLCFPKTEKNKNGKLKHDKMCLGLIPDNETGFVTVIRVMHSDRNVAAQLMAYTPKPGWNDIWRQLKRL